jgi:hypothetical protein
MRSTIFIGSSQRAKPLVKSLANLLRLNMTEGEIEVKEWFGCFPPSRSILDSLMEMCQHADFAAVFLTRDEAVLARDEAIQKEKSILLAPRDNCIFEAGLFMGTWGGPRRCFLLSSFEFEKIFSDLHGLAVLRIIETEDHETIHSAAAAIEKAIKALGPVRKPELECYSEAEVLEREQVGKGQLLEGSQVLINLKRPIEVDREFGDKIIQNLKENVHYRYFFSADEDLRLIAQVVRSVATAGGEPTLGNNDPFKANLALMEKRLRISLLPQGKPPEFCIHNAHREQATCYLRRPEDKRFVEWCRGDQANEFVKDIQGDQLQLTDRRIFRSSREFDLYGNKNVLAALTEFIRQEFEDSSVHESVLKVCFGEEVAPIPRPRSLRARKSRSAEHARRSAP